MVDIYVKMKIVLEFLPVCRSVNCEFHNRAGMKEGEKMIEKIKGLSEKLSLAIGLTLILGNILLIFLLSIVFPINMWVAMIEGVIVTFISILFLLNASAKRRSRIDKGK